MRIMPKGSLGGALCKTTLLALIAGSSWHYEAAAAATTTTGNLTVRATPTTAANYRRSLEVEAFGSKFGLILESDSDLYDHGNLVMLSGTAFESEGDNGDLAHSDNEALFVYDKGSFSVRINAS